MNTKTKCNKCIFADHADSEQPCAADILSEINGHKTIVVEDNFNNILHYRCPMAFSMDVYKNNISEIQSIDNLKTKLINNAKIDYYMVVFLDPEHIKDVCQSIRDLPILPKFISFAVTENNTTEILIDILNQQIPQNTGWKLHNFLEKNSYQESLDAIFDTNTHKNNIQYFWVNNSDTHTQWANDILSINRIIVYQQPFLHALYRKDIDGMFLTFKNYYSMLELDKSDIANAIKTIETPLIKYYG